MPITLTILALLGLGNKPIDSKEQRPNFYLRWAVYSCKRHNAGFRGETLKISNNVASKDFHSFKIVKLIENLASRFIRAKATTYSLDARKM